MLLGLDVLLVLDLDGGIVFDPAKFLCTQADIESILLTDLGQDTVDGVTDLYIHKVLDALLSLDANLLHGGVGAGRHRAKMGRC